MAEIEIKNIQKKFGDFVAVRESSFTVKDGEFFVMLGPSGCGKTTTLRMIAGLEMPTSGQVLLDGEDVTYLRGSKRDIAFVFQMFALYPHMNVRKNLSFPLRMQHMPRKKIKQRINEVASMLRIEHILDKPVGGLSSGDRQRVALGRALVRRAKAFLMDEPLGALDAAFRELMCEELRQLHKRVEATTVYVTHDQIEAMSMADRICVMDHAEVLQIGSPAEIYKRPKTRFVAGFIGSPAINFLSAKGGISAGEQSVQIQGKPVAVPMMQESYKQDEVILGVRPEHIQLTDISNKGALKGKVFAVEYQGTRQLITVETASGNIRVRAPNTVHAKEGDNVGLDFNTPSIMLFDSESDRALKSDLYTGAKNG